MLMSDVRRAVRFEMAEEYEGRLRALEERVAQLERVRPAGGGGGWSPWRSE